MCGRYTLVSDLVGGYRRLWQSSGNELKGVRPRYNVAPMQQVPILIPTPRGVELVLAQWGYIPPWSDTRRPKLSTFNAKCEGLAQSRLWSAPATRPQPGVRGRCLVLCDGFYEWQKVPGGKQPLRMRRPDGALFSLAGLYCTWYPPGGADTPVCEDEAADKSVCPTSIYSCTIVTCEPNTFMARIHHRMAVILDEAAEARWLDPEASWDECAALLRPCPDDLLIAEPVSPLVNSVKNDVPECVAVVG